jgi:hypothetical protein
VGAVPSIGIAYASRHVRGGSAKKGKIDRLRQDRATFELRVSSPTGIPVMKMTKGARPRNSSMTKGPELYNL